MKIDCPACRQSIMVPALPTIAPPEERTIQIKISTLWKIAKASTIVLLIAGIAFTVFTFMRPIVLRGSQKLSTPKSYRPPVEITVVAKTDSTNLRLAYAADQIIFNWEVNPYEFRIDGGPASGLHKPGAGHIPKNKYVTVKWIVTTRRQAIYVDGKLRFEHEGDYSQINRPVTVFPANGSTIWVKSIKVRKIPDV